MRLLPSVDIDRVPAGQSHIALDGQRHAEPASRYICADRRRFPALDAGFHGCEVRSAGSSGLRSAGSPSAAPATSRSASRHCARTATRSRCCVLTPRRRPTAGASFASRPSAMSPRRSPSTGTPLATRPMTRCRHDGERSRRRSCRSFINSGPCHGVSGLP